MKQVIDSVLGGLSAAAVVSVALLSGCAAPVPVAKPQPPDPIMGQLDAALKAPAVKLGPISPEAKPVAPVYDANFSSVTYWGDASVLLKDIARHMKLEYKQTGPIPHLPIYVQIDVKGVPIREVLTQVARQLSQRADIVLSGRGLELRYRGG